MSFQNALCFTLLIFFSAAADTKLMVKQIVGCSDASLMIAHLSEEADKLLSRPLDLCNYNKVLHGQQLTFTRPIGSELNIASPYKEGRVVDFHGQAESFTRFRPGKSEDAYLVYPSAVLRKPGGAIDSMTIGVTAIDVAKAYKGERTGIFLNVSDDDKKVTINVSQIHTDKSPKFYTFSVENQGGKKVKENEFTFEGVESVTVNFNPLSNISVPEYELKTHESAIFHAEQEGKVKVILKKNYSTVLVIFEEYPMV